MEDLMRGTLQCIFPEADKLEIIGDCKGTEGFNGIMAGIQEVVHRRARGDLRPVVVYGFDSMERIQQRERGAILNAPGVFYLKLPALLSHVKSILQKAANFKVLDQDIVDNESIRRYAIQRIRAFKHTCDNVWMSMEGNTNAARSSLNDSPGTKPSALKEFRQARIKRLAEEYSQLESLATRLGIEGAEQVTNIMVEVIDMIGRIHEDAVSSKDAIELAAECVKKMQDVSKILSKAKELERNEKTSTLYR
jgi:hypothetical protein